MSNKSCLHGSVYCWSNLFSIWCSWNHMIKLRPIAVFLFLKFHYEKDWSFFSNFDHKRWWYKNQCIKEVVLLGQSCYLSEQSTNEKGFYDNSHKSIFMFHCFDCKFKLQLLMLLYSEGHVTKCKQMCKTTLYLLCCLFKKPLPTLTCTTVVPGF